MIEFYNRQANCGIRADPVECISAMKERGLEPLKETQIEHIPPEEETRNGAYGCRHPKPSQSNIFFTS